MRETLVDAREIACGMALEFECPDSGHYFECDELATAIRKGE